MGQVCKSYQCQDHITTCAASTNTTVVLNPGICRGDQEWFFSGNEFGQWAKKINRNFESLFYPGYNCRYEKQPGLCAFGGKYCNKYGFCEGYSLDEHCQRHSDCYYGYYCSPYGRCVPNKKEGEACVLNEECERGNMCFYKCVKLLSLDSDAQVLPEFERVVYEQEGNEKMCGSGWYNRTTGRCFSGVKSLQKGKVCSTYLDCPTTVEDIFALCKCGFSVKGQKYCDIEGDDDEWQSVLEAFK